MKNKSILLDVFDHEVFICKQSFSSETIGLAGVCLLLFIFINLQDFFGFDFLLFLFLGWDYVIECMRKSEDNSLE